MTPVTPSLVFLLVSIAFTSIHMVLTVPLISTTLLVTRVLPHMTLVSSTALTFLFRWFVLSVRTPSSLRSDSRLATAWLPTHSLRVQPSVLVLLPRTPTATTVASRSKTSCDHGSHISSGGLRTPFFYLNINKTPDDCFTI